jgi:hypothetical protein
MQTGQLAPMFTPEQESKMVRFAQDSVRHFRTLLQDTHTRWVDNWKTIYFAKRPDPRDPITEKWRAHVTVPQGFFNTEAKVAQLVEILFSADPPVQPDAVFESGQAAEDEISRLINYTMRRNSMRRLLASTLRAVSVQGGDFLKSTWAKKTVTVPRRPAGERLMEDFERMMNEARMQRLVLPTTPDPAADPKGFEEWRQLVNKTRRLNGEIPPYPLGTGPVKVIRFEGPYVERTSPYHVFFDPEIEDWYNQPIIVHEMFKPRSWLESRTGDGPDKPFDTAAVGRAMESWHGEGLNSKQTEIANAIGIPSSAQQNPQLELPVQIWEVYRLNSEFPFQVILNEQSVVNKNPRQMPYEDGEVPITPIRNIVVPGFALGPGDYDAPKALFVEQDVLRSLRLDKVLLHTLPVFKKRQSVGLPDLQKRIMPGGFVEVQSMDAIEPLLGGDINPSAYQEIGSIASDIDRAMGLGDNVRGSTATVGRIPATTETQRLTQALTRMKLHAITIEEDLGMSVQQWLSRWAQFGFTLREKVSGSPDPLKGISQEQLREALFMNYSFRGATQALQKELQAQQLMTFVDKFKESMLPTEIRALMVEVGTALGLRSLSKIVSADGTKLLTLQYQQQLQAQSAQQQQQTQGAEMQMEAANTPNSMPVGGPPPEPGGAPPPPGPPQ